MKHRYLKNVATLRLSIENCIGCGRCAEVCPIEFSAWMKRKHGLKIKTVVWSAVLARKTVLKTPLLLTPEWDVPQPWLWAGLPGVSRAVIVHAVRNAAEISWQRSKLHWGGKNAKKDTNSGLLWSGLRIMSAIKWERPFLYLAGGKMIESLDKRLTTIRERSGTNKSWRKTWYESESPWRQSRKSMPTWVYSCIKKVAMSKSLRGLSLYGLFLTILGSKEEQLEKERQRPGC